MRMRSRPQHCQVSWHAHTSDAPGGYRRYPRVVVWLWVAIGVLSAPVQATERESRCAQVSHMWEAFWNDRAGTHVLDVFTRDVLYEDLTLDVHARGARELQAFAQSVFADFPVSHFQVEDSACQGHRGFLDWTWVAEDGIAHVPGTGLCGTGKRFTVRGATLLTIQGYKIAHNVDIWDLTTVLRQLLPEGEDCVTRLLGLSPP